MPTKLMGVLGILLLGAACSPITSTYIDDQDVVLEGVPYHLPRGRIKVELRAGLDSRNVPIMYEIQLLGTEYDPDPKATFVLNYHPSLLSDDDLCVTRKSNGLLTSVQFAAADRTDDIALRIAETVVAFPLLGGAAIAPSGKTILSPTQRKIAKFETVYTATFDPLDEDERQSVESALSQFTASHYEAILDSNAKRSGGVASVLDQFGDINKLNTNLAKGKVIEFRIPSDFSDGEYPLDDQNFSDERTDGIYFTTSVSVPLDIYENGKVSRRVIIEIPNYRYVGKIDISRALAVKKVTKIGLEDGLLTSISINKPSEGLEIASLPLEIMGAIVEVPARFFTAIAKATQSQAAATQAQASLILAQAELEKARAATIDSIKNKTDPDATGTALGGQIDEKSSFDSGIDCVKLITESD